MGRRAVVGLAVALVWAAPVVPTSRELVPPQTALGAFSIDAWQASRDRATAGSELGAWRESSVLPAGDTVMVGADWGGDPDLTVEVRGLDASAWTPWFALELTDEHLPDPDTAEAEAVARSTASEPVWLGDVDALQFRVAGGQPRLTVHTVAVRGGDGLGWAPDATTRRPAAANAATTSPGIATRASWGADDSLRNGPVRYADDVRFAVIHHTAGTQPDVASGCADADDIVRGTYAYHTNVRGFDDIAYNFAVDPCGGVWEGRKGGIERAVIGAHAAGWNGGSVGVVLLGNYGAGVTVPQAMEEATTELLAWKFDVHHLDPHGQTTELAGGGDSNRYPEGALVDVPVLSAHQITNATSCPGEAVMAQFFDGRTTAATPTDAFVDAVHDTGLPKAFGGLPQAWEQPVAGPRPTWDVTLTESSDWRLEVTSEDGTVVRSTGGVAESAVSRTWDLRDADGELVPGGRYTATLTASGLSGEIRPVVTELEVTPPSERKAGEDRVETAVAFSRWAFDSSEEVVLASAKAFPDALAATPLAGSYHAPVLLIQPNGVDEVVLDEIARLGAYRAFVVGGTAAISGAVEEQLRAAGMRTIERFGGVDRWQTAALVADRVIAREDPDEVLIALGRHAEEAKAFPDALAAGAFGAWEELPLLLVDQNVLPGPTADRLSRLRPDRITVFGGDRAVAERIADEAAAAAGGATLVRFAGEDRYDTARLAAIDRLERIAADDGPRDPHAVDRGLEVVLASGVNWPDALGAGAAAAQRGASFLLTHDADLDRAAATVAFLDAYADRLAHAVVAGGPAAVVDEVLVALRDLVLAAGPHTAAPIAWPRDPREPEPQPSPTMTLPTGSSSPSPSPSPSTSSSPSPSPSPSSSPSPSPSDKDKKG